MNGSRAAVRIWSRCTVLKRASAALVARKKSKNRPLLASRPRLRQLPKVLGVDADGETGVREGTAPGDDGQQIVSRSSEVSLVGRPVLAM